MWISYFSSLAWLSRCSATTDPSLVLVPYSRLELLDIVRKHSENLLKPQEFFASSLRPVDGALMDPRYWKEVLDLFFVRGWSLGETSIQFDRGSLFDDMLFFVRNEENQVRMPPLRAISFHIAVLTLKCFIFQDVASTSEVSDGFVPHDKQPFFVRRWGNDVSTVVAASTVLPSKS